jgi:UDP-2,4-diacetamido-2,4,6-trideoxy-beta-L-altropyranose hydrolase
MTNVAFRTDASLQIGTGHVMRCLTLADALLAAGIRCHFICREHPGNLIEQIRQRGFPVSVFPASAGAPVPLTDGLGASSQPIHAAWLGVDWATDSEQTKVCIGDTVVDWMIVDHYALDARWEQAVRPLCRKLMVIDDLVDRPHDCDLLLDQNLGRDEVDYRRLVPDACTVLTGARYALLRPEFAALREDGLRRRTRPQLKHMLIAMGGVDQADATGKVLEALMGCALPSDMRITVVMGSHAPWLERVQSLARQMPQVTEVKVNIINMAQLMAESDFAIGAAGSTSWERCCLGLPSIICVQAANQQLIANALELSGAAKAFSLHGGVKPMRELIEKILGDDRILEQMSASAFAITDGKGVTRVSAEFQSTVPT